MTVFPLRPVQLEFSEQEARAVAAAIDLAAHVGEGALNGGETLDLRVLQRRILQGAEIARVERQLGR